MDRDKRASDHIHDEMEPGSIDDASVHGETHATMGGAAAAGAVTGGVIGLTGGPIGAAIGAVGGAIVGAAAERMMHSDDDSERARAGFDNDQDRNPTIEDRANEPLTGTTATPPVNRTDDETTTRP